MYGIQLFQIDIINILLYLRIKLNFFFFTWRRPYSKTENVSNNRQCNQLYQMLQLLSKPWEWWLNCKRFASYHLHRVWSCRLYLLVHFDEVALARCTLTVKLEEILNYDWFITQFVTWLYISEIAINLSRLSSCRSSCQDSWDWKTKSLGRTWV